MTFCPDMVSDPVISFYFNLFALGEGDVMNVWFSDEAVRCSRWGLHRLRFAGRGHLEPDGRRDQRFGMHHLAVHLGRDGQFQLDGRGRLRGAMPAA